MKAMPEHVAVVVIIPHIYKITIFYSLQYVSLQHLFTFKCVLFALVNSFRIYITVVYK